jgi:excisionase family DNA binding protein
MSDRQILTPAQAAGLLGLGKTTVVEWCQRSILPAIRIESRWYLKRAELIRDGWLEGPSNHACGVAPTDEGQIVARSVERVQGRGR